ncbi:hypothetical protein ACWEKR_22460 [Nocardia sp. NPDC004573]
MWRLTDTGIAIPRLIAEPEQPVFEVSIVDPRHETHVYSGLRPQARAPAAYFVIPHERYARQDRIVAVPRSDNVRLDLNATRID